MKLKDIALMYKVDANEFSRFLISNQLEYKKGLLSGFVVDNSRVDSYVTMFRQDLAKKAEQERKRAEEEARIRAAEEAKKQALLEAERKAKEEEQRNERIVIAQKAFAEMEQQEIKELDSIEEGERSNYIMANSVKLSKEKLIGEWRQSGASYADNDLFGLWITGFKYTGKDGVVSVTSHSMARNTDSVCVYVTGDETGKSYLYACGSTNGFCHSFGELAFSDDNNYFTLRCKSSSFLFERIG